MPHLLETAYRNAAKKAYFHWHDALTKARAALGRRSFPDARKKGGRPLLPELGVIVLRGQQAAEGMTLPADFPALVAALAAQAAERLAKTEECILRSADEAITARLAAGHLPARTEDVPEVQRGEVATIRLRRTLDLPGLADIARALIPQVEDRVHHAPVVVETATVYRHRTSALPEYSSILWHTDNHFDGVMKIMVYLTDVTEDTAPFEYLRHKETHRTVRVRAQWPQKYPKGRVPQEVIDAYLRDGYETVKVTGPQGTVLVFDEKNIHKGNYARQGYRDVLVLQLRPAWRTGLPYIHPRWSTSV